MNKLSIKVTSNAKTLSSFSGIHIFADLISKFGIQSMIGAFLPKKSRQRGFTSFEKAYSMILGFIAGAECLDDMDLLGLDPLFYEHTGSPSSITCGNFLRSFSQRQVEQIRNLLPELALKLRLWLRPETHKIIFKMDATIHQQYGKQEGVEYSYREVNGLSSQNLFDDLGLCYGFALRNGAAHSSVGAVEMMENAFRLIPAHIQKFFVADSAYANTNIYNSLLNHNVNFAICLGEIVWGSLLRNYGNKISWQSTRMRFFKTNKCEIGEVIYPKKDLVKGLSFLRVVFIRAKKKKMEPGDNHPYHYYALVTNMSNAEMTSEGVIRLYRRRAQVENNIKDLKNGMDFHHFPCHSLKANHAWGLFGMIAYNLMRLCSFSLYPKTGCFVRTTRRRLVTLAGEVIKHARSIEIRMMDYLAKEVNRLLNMIRSSYYQAEEAGAISLPNGRIRRQEAL